MKLLCWIGLHFWVYARYPGSAQRPTRWCDGCHKRQVGNPVFGDPFDLVWTDIAATKEER